MGLRRRNADADPDPEPDLSPMIDCVFILLIFFIVTAVFVEEDGLPYRVPEQTSQSFSKVDNKTVLIAVSADNTVVAGGQGIGVDGVRAFVEAKIAVQDDASVVVQSAAKAKHGTVTAVQNEVLKVVDPEKLTMISK